jgi:type I restriction enzyme M protein
MMTTSKSRALIAIEPIPAVCYSADSPQNNPVDDDNSLQWTALDMAAHNERLTENIVRDELQQLGYKKKASKIIVEEQRSQIEAVKRLMKSASKSGGGGGGSPEFIISCASNPDFLVIIECKADTKDHISPACKKLLIGSDIDEDDVQYSARVQKFAVDGAIHYAKSLSKEFNVVAVAVSGQTKGGSSVSSYLYPKGASNPKLLQTKDGSKVDGIVPWSDYVEHGTFDPTVQRVRSDELMSFSRDLHEFMRDHAKLTESEKPLLVSGTLIALCNKAFAKSFDEHTPEELQNEWLEVIVKEVHKANIPKAKKDKMAQPYSTIAAHPVLGKSTKDYPKGVLHELIKRLNDKVWPFISIYHDFDVVGQFYGEFLKYTGGDKKALGIVLTPRHITELFSLLANVDKSSRVLDICAGTGGFLISAMHQMMKTAVTDRERERIKSNGLVGVEEQPNMFALAASNMILRGDGKANLYQGSCFDDEIITEIKQHKCTVGLLNPPFSQTAEDQQELHFIKQMLDCLKKGGVGIGLAPVSCANVPNPMRDELLKNHTLDAVMSLPVEMFYPVGTVACAMVFTAHVPHATSGKKTWFGYWRDDGFVKTKHRGRVDQNHKWPEIRDRWVSQFRNREVHPGESVLQSVTADDEWCAEAYMETDYSMLSQSKFEATVKDYAMFKLFANSGATMEDVTSGNS